MKRLFIVITYTLLPINEVADKDRRFHSENRSVISLKRSYLRDLFG
ncbi:hypothetical protein Q7O_001068 [Pectobacterium carotovorum subsp. carotovorum PCCS1]|nr:hypothetical protein [Pectobacterium carotovorum subsp. carotovorum PCCS1]